MNFITKNTLLRGGMVMFLGTTVVNIGSYLFYLIIGRLLEPGAYGILSSLVSSLYILGIIPLALGIVIVRFVSDAKGRGDEEEISALYSWINKKIVFYGFIMTILLFLIIPFWMSFLKLSDPKLLLLTTLIFPVMLLVVNIRSFFTGMLQFGAYNIGIISEIAFKILSAVFFIYIGWSVFGAILGMFLAIIFSFVISLPFLHLKKANQSFGKYQKTKHLILYCIPAVLMTLSMTSLFSSDIILVKHYFTSFEAGIYASLSVLGKIVFFAASSLISVMFPLVSQKHAKGENYRHILWLTFVVVGLIDIALATLYFIFPYLMINLLFGTKYLSGAPMLFLFAIFMSFYSLSNVMINYFLSIGKTKAVVFPLLGAFAQIILISAWHQTVSMVIIDSVLVTLSLLLVLFGYYFYESNK